MREKVCSSPIDEGRLACRAASCRNVFPIIDGVPVLINEDASVFWTLIVPV